MPAALGPGPAPSVLVFHGGGGDGPGTERLTRFSALADREAFLVAYPEGLGRNGNDGRVCHDFDATALIWEFFEAHPKGSGD